MQGLAVRNSVLPVFLSFVYRNFLHAKLSEDEARKRKTDDRKEEASEPAPAPEKLLSKPAGLHTCVEETGLHTRVEQMGLLEEKMG